MNDDEDIGWSLDENGNETNLRLYSVGGDVNITVKGDAVVKGNIYAGGSWDTTATRTLGDTEIILSGGKVTGNIYGAGNRDIVVGNTHVTFLGNGTVLSEGSIVSGGGINGAEVLGTRYLHIGEVDIETTCSLNIMDFDEIIIAKGSEANLNSVAMTRSALPPGQHHPADHHRGHRAYLHPEPERYQHRKAHHSHSVLRRGNGA